QFAGGLAGVLLMGLLLGGLLADPPVRYVATVPAGGTAAAFATEVVISFALMTLVLTVSNRRSIARLTGLCAAALVAANITVAAPISGMSMNPARSLGSALPAGLLGDLWIYFTAPPLGMLAAAELWRRRGNHVSCAKLHHQNSRRCIFCRHYVTGEAGRHPNRREEFQP